MGEDSVTSKEWDQFLMTLGKLAFAMGSLEMTLIAMHSNDATDADPAGFGKRF
jgi:hypothetical protein